MTLEGRRKIELMWRYNESPVKIAAALEISQCTVYTELKRGQETDGAGDVVLDENFWSTSAIGFLPVPFGNHLLGLRNFCFHLP